MNNSKLTENEERFCLVFACGPSPYNGNAPKTYDLVYNKSLGVGDPNEENRIIADVDSSLAARELMLREDIKERIEQIQSENLINASTLAPRLTSTLLRIVDECSTLTVVDRFGKKVSPAALRSVAVNATRQLMEMWGIKEDIAHKVIVEGADGDGITFNLVVPESNKENELDKLIE